MRFMLHKTIRHSIGAKRLFLNTLIVIACLGVLFVISERTSIIRRFVAKVVNTPSSKVLGTNVIDVKNADVNPADQIKKDIQQELDTVKKQSLNIKVSDVIDTTSRVQKIFHDVHSLQTFVGQIQKIVPKF